MSLFGLDHNAPMPNRIRGPTEKLSSIVDKLTECQFLDDFYEASDGYDLDGGGGIDMKELNALLRSRGQSSEEITAMLGIAGDAVALPNPPPATEEDAKRMAMMDTAFRAMQIAELKRLGSLVMIDADDPMTGKLARMPLQREKMLGLGRLWSTVVLRGTRKDEFVKFVGDAFDVDALILKWKTKAHEPDEQMAELKRLGSLVMAGADDPKTGGQMRMPRRGEKKLGLDILWSKIVNKGQRKEEFVKVVDGAFDVDVLIAKCKTTKAHDPDEQMAELMRLGSLVLTGANDPMTGKPARMPPQSEKKLGLGNLWSKMILQCQRKDEFVNVVGGAFDVDALIAKWKHTSHRKRKAETDSS